MVDLTAEIVLFDGFDELDAIGPYEVLENGAVAGASLETRLVTLAEPDLVTASHGLRVEPDGTIGRPDLLLVPGGGWTTADSGVRAAVEDERTTCPRRSPSAPPPARPSPPSVPARWCWPKQVCSRARPATTHRVATEDLEAAAGEVVDARVVDDGDVLTAGGVTAGIDLALWLLEREFGAAIAAAVETEMEHERRGEVVD